MIQERRRILLMIDHTLEELEDAVERSVFAAIDENTRMILCLGEILNAYYPGAWTAKLALKAIHGFEAALTRTKGSIEGTRVFARQRKSCLHNVGIRLRVLKRKMPDWCPRRNARRHLKYA